jgi:Spy/CpxP family protein refolding chaperone
MRRTIVLILLSAATAFPQLPRSLYPWWSKPIAQELDLSNEQRRQVRLTIQEYRPRLLELRASIDQAEADLETQFNQQPVDTRKANEAVERLASARADLTRTLSQMSLKLRTLLSQKQWEELQRRRPVRGQQPSEQPEP